MGGEGGKLQYIPIPKKKIAVFVITVTECSDLKWEERENMSGSIHRAKQMILHSFLHNIISSQKESTNIAHHHKE